MPFSAFSAPFGCWLWRISSSPSSPIGKSSQKPDNPAGRPSYRSTNSTSSLKRLAVPCPNCVGSTGVCTASRSTTHPRQPCHHNCHAVQEGRFFWSRRWLYHRSCTGQSYLQHDSGLWSVSVSRRTARWLFL